MVSPHIFSRNTPTHLYLKASCTLLLSIEISLPSLNSLTFDNITFLDVDSLKNLFSSRALEELCLYSCRWDHISTIIISAPNLKNLYIINYENSQVMIHEYNLYSLHMHGICNDYLLSNLLIQSAEVELYHDGMPTDPLMSLKG